jgi:hypothetical protein
MQWATACDVLFDRSIGVSSAGATFICLTVSMACLISSAQPYLQTPLKAIWFQDRGKHREMSMPSMAQRIPPDPVL